MRGIEAQRAAIRQLVLQQLGVDPAQTRPFVGQANTAPLAGAYLRLPATLAPQVDLQDQTTGTFYFMADSSPIDSEDYEIQ